MLGKYDALYRVMSNAFGMSAFEVNRMKPWEAAADLDIQPEVEGIRRIGPSRSIDRRADPRAQRATAEERERAAEFRRQLVAAQEANA